MSKVLDILNRIKNINRNTSRAEFIALIEDIGQIRDPEVRKELEDHFKQKLTTSNRFNRIILAQLEDYEGLPKEYGTFLNNVARICYFLKKTPTKSDSSAAKYLKTNSASFSWSIDFNGKNINIFYKIEKNRESIKIPELHFSLNLVPGADPVKYLQQIIEAPIPMHARHHLKLKKLAQLSEMDLKLDFDIYTDHTIKLIKYLESEYPKLQRVTLPLGFQYFDGNTALTVFLPEIKLKVRYGFTASAQEDHTSLIIDSPIDKDLDHYERYSVETDPLPIVKKIISDHISKHNLDRQPVNLLASHILNRIEKLEKSSPSDEKLDLWNDIKQISDPLTQKMLADKFKAKVASSFFNLMMKYAASIEDIEDIENTGVVGNYYHDQALWKAIDEFMLEDHPIEEKIRALQKVNEIVGESLQVTEGDVYDYIEDLKDNLGPAQGKTNRFRVLAQDSPAESWYREYYHQCEELMSYVNREYIYELKSHPKEDFEWFNKNREADLTFYLPELDLTFSYVMSVNKTLAPLLFLRSKGGPKSGHLTSAIKLHPTHPVVEIFKFEIENIAETKQKKDEAFKEVEPEPDNFEQEVLRKIERIDKGAPADDKLDLWNEIQKVEDPRSKKMLVDKFKAKLASRLVKRKLFASDYPDNYNETYELKNKLNSVYKNLEKKVTENMSRDEIIKLIEDESSKVGVNLSNFSYWRTRKNDIYGPRTALFMLVRQLANRASKLKKNLLTGPEAEKRYKELTMEQKQLFKSVSQKDIDIFISQIDEYKKAPNRSLEIFYNAGLSEKALFSIIKLIETGLSIQYIENNILFN